MEEPKWDEFGNPILPKEPTEREKRLARRQECERAFWLFAQEPSGQRGKGMGTAKFARLCRESGLLVGSITQTVADLAFTRVKDRGSAVISFKQFLRVLEQLSIVAEEEDEEPQEGAYEAMLRKVEASQGPAIRARENLPDIYTEKPSRIMSKLYDTGQYTGAHRNRFDRKTGKGRGKAGRTVGIGLGRTVASHFRSSTSYQIR